MEISEIPISINPEYEKAVPKLSKNEFELLISSIKEKGLWDPIITNDKGVILDGHHRFRSCQLLGIGIPSHLFSKRSFDNPLEEELYVNEVNLLRRQLNPSQRVQQALKIKAILQKMAKLNMSLGGKGVQIQTHLGRVNKHLADKANVKLTQFSQIEYGLNNASAEEKKKLLAGTIKPNKLYGRLRNDQFLKEAIARNKIQDNLFTKATDKITLWVGDFEARCSEIKNDSVSLVLTDPLYDEEHLYLYDGLGKWAMQLLCPGGSLITYINQSKLLVIGTKLENSGLTFWWPLGLRMNGDTSRMFNWQMEVDFKILLWFVKGKRPINPSFPKSKNDWKRSYLGDLIISEVPDKRFHDFGQNPKDAEFIMKYLTATNDLVLDPFVGGGSTAVACMNMKRRFIGIDIDPTAIERTKANLRVNLEINKEEKFKPTECK